jgi:hypothetical protein
VVNVNHSADEVVPSGVESGPPQANFLGALECKNDKKITQKYATRVSTAAGRSGRGGTWRRGGAETRTALEGSILKEEEGAVRKAPAQPTQQPSKVEFLLLLQGRVPPPASSS